MAAITLQYSVSNNIKQINSALQVGDHVFYTSTSTSGNYTVNDSISETYGNTYIGTVKSIGASTVQVTISDNDMVLPFATDYFFFVKDNNVNDSGVLGYYSQVKIENDSTSKAELFSVAAEIFESSK